MYPMEYMETHTTKIDSISKKNADRLSSLILIDTKGITEVYTSIAIVLLTKSILINAAATPHTAATMHIAFDNMLQILSNFTSASETAAASR